MSKAITINDVIEDLTNTLTSLRAYGYYGEANCVATGIDLIRALQNIIATNGDRKWIPCNLFLPDDAVVLADVVYDDCDDEGNETGEKIHVCKLLNFDKKNKKFFDGNEEEVVRWQYVPDVYDDTGTDDKPKSKRKKNPMTKTEAIKELRASMDLYLFDPTTGRNLIPELLNDLDRMTYDAMEFAAMYLENHLDPDDCKETHNLHRDMGTNRFFYTFGSDPKFPYGINDFVEVHADNLHQANLKFMGYFPCREPDSKVLNCASFYTEKEWEAIHQKYYPGVRPVEIIV